MKRKSIENPFAYHYAEMTEQHVERVDIRAAGKTGAVQVGLSPFWAMWTGDPELAALDPEDSS